MLIRGGVKRDKSIDILKGIGISFVLIAHSLGGYIHTFAYSFHMPLFFIISGYFFYPKPIWVTLKKDFRRLMIPFFFTALIIFLGTVFLEPFGFKEVKTPRYAFEALIYGNASSVNYHKIWGNFACVGSVWFLGALFWSKSIFNILFNKFSESRVVVILMSLSVCFVIISQYILLPYSIIQGITALPFLLIGYKMKQLDFFVMMRQPLYKFIFILFAFLWFVSTFQSCLDMAQMKWSYYYIPNILLATAGTCVFYIISLFINYHFSLLSSFLSFLGRYSIVLVCFPVIETYIIPLKEIIPSEIPFHSIILLGCKVVWVAVTLWLSIHVPILKKVFSIK